MALAKAALEARALVHEQYQQHQLNVPQPERLSECGCAWCQSVRAAGIDSIDRLVTEHTSDRQTSRMGSLPTTCGDCQQHGRVLYLCGDCYAALRQRAERAEGLLREYADHARESGWHNLAGEIERRLAALGEE